MDEPVRILFVDATSAGEENAQRLADIDERFDVRHREHATAALDCVRDSPLDCVVSDYELPGTDGIELLRSIRDVDSYVPFVLFPSDGNESIASETFAAGGTGYLMRGDGQYETLATRIEQLVRTTPQPTDPPSESEYHTLVELSPVPMFVVDRQFEVLYANPSAGEYIGDGDPEQLLGKKATRFVPPDDRDASLDRLEAVFETREPVEVREYRYLTLDSETRYAVGTIVPVTFEGTSAAQIVLEDITEQKQREQRLERRREQIERLHDVGVKLAGCESPQAVYEQTTEAAEDILSMDMCLIGVVEDGRLTVGASSTEIGEEDYHEPPVDSKEAGIAGKSYRRNESYLIKDITEFPDANPVQDYQSCIMTPIGNYGTFQAVSYEEAAFDETDMELVEILVGHANEALTRIEHEQTLREQRDQLTRENERLDEFASIVSHDLRNPLNVVKGRLKHVQEQLDNEHIDIALQSANRMDTLISDLLTLARQGQEVSEYDAVGLADLVESCWDNVDTKTATLVVETDAVIRADVSRCQELLENLVRNAIEHGTTDEDRTHHIDTKSDSGTDLTITIGDLPEKNGFYVQDNGPGIPPDVRNEIFQSGFTTSDDGTGFGLAIVNRIVQAHGWEIAVAESPSGGARFEITDVDIEWE